MPEINDYLDGFGMAVGNKYGSYKVTNINIGHHSEVLYNKYSYPIDITLENNINPSMDEANKAIQALFNAVNVIKIIYTPAGRPYESTFFHNVQPQITHNDNYSVIHFITNGYAIRLSKKEVEQIEKDGRWITK